MDETTFIAQPYPLFLVWFGPGLERPEVGRIIGWRIDAHGIGDPLTQSIGNPFDADESMDARCSPETHDTESYEDAAGMSWSHTVEPEGLWTTIARAQKLIDARTVAD